MLSRIAERMQHTPNAAHMPMLHSLTSACVSHCVLLSIINPEGSVHGYGKGGDWEPTLTIKHVMQASSEHARTHAGSEHARAACKQHPPTNSRPTLPPCCSSMQALQAFLDEATGLAAGRTEEYRLYKNDRPEYERRVKQQAAKAEQQP